MSHPKNQKRFKPSDSKFYSIWGGVKIEKGEDGKFYKKYLASPGKIVRTSDRDYMVQPDGSFKLIDDKK
jgi:hypothetical protein